MTTKNILKERFLSLKFKFKRAESGG